ncbi:GGDEF domain-containing protein [Erwinia pyrifoliae]|uniref:GGDEF domain-containing protein n=1 Tax=Erwinia pyrifoliae TaxID=79967 RepID=UPI0021FA9882|nr:sensor domain-containing diguanylate cyclase [Erwinia pyrifoliae]UWS30774.1 diguanylate cyclase [Erwinia pyrifoliae]
MPNNTYHLSRAIMLFTLAMLLSSIGFESRHFASLSLFWPCNAVFLGLLVRFPSLDKSGNLLVLYMGMLCAELCFGNDIMVAIGLNAANIVFITTARWVLLTLYFRRTFTRRLQALLHLFPASLLGAAACAVVGAVVSQHYFDDDLVKAWSSWFSEQMSTSILLLPLMISLPRRQQLPQLAAALRDSSVLPLLTLIVTIVSAIWLGGGGSLLFPLPALLWCAISYPLFVTCFLTMLTGISEIILVAGNVLNIQGKGDLFRIDSLSSARLGVAAMLIGPLIVSLSTLSNKKLVARITRRADYDFLTGALTRSGLSTKLDSLVTGRNRQQGFIGAALVIDIDRFKDINDTWGHAAGDYVLAKTAECLREGLSPSTLVCRMGGEEFLILIQGMTQPRSSLLANRLRQNVENNKIIFNGHDLSVTVSIGISSLNISNVNSLDESIMRADEQLYIAKSSGRNQVRPEFVL